MSGICGVFALDGSEPELGPILEQLERRGPEGMRQWSDGAVALGHTLLATTPEALVEVLPLTDATSGCTITADARLDNREELIAALDLSGETRTIGDGELILRSYLQWGEDCPKHLLGDFAFAIWDPHQQHLFCARDHMGMRQFNYCYLPRRLLVMATEDTAVFAHHAVPKTLDEGKIADLIADIECFDLESTFFDSVRKLPPAHSLTIGDSGLKLRRYWLLRPSGPLKLESDAAYAVAFMAVFTDAVRCRLRTAGGVGAMLSGGLDSTSLVAVAAGITGADGRGRLKTLSAVSPDATNCPETTAIHSALAIENLDPLFVNKIDFNGMSAALIAELETMRSPFEVHGSMLRNIYLTAKANGLKVVLDGGAGDVVLTSMNRIAALLGERRFKRAAREFEGERRFWQPQSNVGFAANVLLPAAWVAFAPLKVRQLWRNFRLSKALPGAKPGFSKRVGFARRNLTADRHIDMDTRSEPERRAQAIEHPNLAAGRERFDQLAASFGVECRDPFMDIRVIEFCLSLPPEQLQRDGWRKRILRVAMEPLIPADLAWRRGKEHIGAEFTRRLLAIWSGWENGMCDPQSPLSAYLSDATLHRLRAGRGKPPSDSTLRLFALDRFLRRWTVVNVDISRPPSYGSVNHAFSE